MPYEDSPSLRPKFPFLASVGRKTHPKKPKSDESLGEQSLKSVHGLKLSWRSNRKWTQLGRISTRNHRSPTEFQSAFFSPSLDQGFVFLKKNYFFFRLLVNPL